MKLRAVLGVALTKRSQRWMFYWLRRALTPTPWERLVDRLADR